MCRNPNPRPGGGGQGKFRRRADEAPDMPAILRSLLEIASGMAYLHSLGVLHGARAACCQSIHCFLAVPTRWCALASGR